MKAYSRTRRIPVVLLANSVASAPLFDEASLVSMGINSYIVRSATSEEFARAISIAATYWLTVDQSAHIAGADVPLDVGVRRNLPRSR
jgi:hypothetical protein